MKLQWKKLIVSVAAPLAVGGLSALLTRRGMEDFATLAQPPLSPPAWLFPVAWTVLYVLMGLACYLVWAAPEPAPNALLLYAVQLFLNFFWSIIFFHIKNYLFAFAWLVLLLAAIVCTTVRFYQKNKTAGYLMVPYVLWVTFAGYLNLGVWLLNR